MSGFTRFPRTKEVLEQAVREGIAPGFAAGIWSWMEPERVEMVAVGDRRLKLKGLDRLPMQTDTLFDLASVSKVFATSTLIGYLVDRGWLRFDTRVKTILPAFKYQDIRIHHLLSHTSGLPAWFPYFERLRVAFGREESVELIEIDDRQKKMREMVFEAVPESTLESKVVYSDLNFLLLGFVIEELLDIPLDEAVSRYVWQSMELKSPHYVRVVEPAFIARDDRYAATEDCPWRRAILQGQVHDDNTWAMGGYAGHAGAFSNLRDLLLFSQQLQSGFLSRETLMQMWTKVSKPEDASRTLGWDTPSGPNPAFSGFSFRSVGHTGFTGTSLWIDIERGVTVALLSNRVHPTRENARIKDFRPFFHRVLASELKADGLI